MRRRWSFIQCRLELKALPSGMLFPALLIWFVSAPTQGLPIAGGFMTIIGRLSDRHCAWCRHRRECNSQEMNAVYRIIR